MGSVLFGILTDVLWNINEQSNTKQYTDIVVWGGSVEVCSGFHGAVSVFNILPQKIIAPEKRSSYNYTLQ